MAMRMAAKLISTCLELLGFHMHKWLKVKTTEVIFKIKEIKSTIVIKHSI